jgi:tetratricopeptide (TPR) repeat protein
MMSRRWVTTVVMAMAMAMMTARAAAASAQLRVSSPYLDAVARYRSGDYGKAVDEVTAFPAVGLRERARKDLLDLTCQVLCGTSDCRRAKVEKPAEFERVVEVWQGTLPAAAALHVDAAVALEVAGRTDAAEVHRTLALEIAELPGVPEPPIAGDGLRRQVTLLSIWLLQLRFELAQIDPPLARAQQQRPGDPLVLLALGSLHEVRARPHALVEASEGRQGNLSAWRREERTYRLDQAADAYTRAIAADAGLAEAHLRLGRVRLLQGRSEEAEAAFTHVATVTADKRWRYLATMFRAGTAESRDDPPAARARYDEALAIWPGSQSAVLAISRLLASEGDWTAAQQHLAVFEPSPGGERPEDPWWAYDFGQAWRLDSGIGVLRGMVKP